MTNLESLLKNGKCVDKPYLRGVYFSQKGTPGWRMIFTQNNKITQKPNGNSLLTKALALNDYITTTAIMTTSKKFLDSVGISTEKNTFYMESNASGTPINANIPGEFAIEDKLITADDLFGVEAGATFIVNIESPFANPFLQEHLPVLNPAKGQAVMIMGNDGKFHEYYRHNELRLVAETPFGHQSIAQFFEKLTNDEFPMYATPSVILSLGKYDDENKTDHLTQLSTNPYLKFKLSVTKNVEQANANSKFEAAIGELLG